MNSTTSTEQQSAAEEIPMTPKLAFGVLLGVIVVVAGFVFLTVSVGVVEMWAGFLFLLYWAGIEHVDMEKLPSCIVGGFFGILLAYLAHGMGALAGVDHNTSLMLFVGLLLVVIYFQILGKFTILINMMTMLYLTVGSIPAIQESASAVGMASALALAILYFGGIAWAGQKLVAAKGAAQQKGNSA